jgi:pimeloyl-ACP methyl ester carboxylesterase
VLSSIRVPILLTHHFREVDAETGAVLGALTDQQAARARELVTRAGQPFTTRDLPGMAHQMHQQDPQLFAEIVDEFVATLDFNYSH